MLSEPEADAIVAAEKTAEAAREADTVARLKKVPALSAVTVREAERRITFRRVALQANAVQTVKENLTGIETGRDGQSPALETGKVREAMSPVFIIAYDDRFSRIQWRDYTIWSNVPFTGLPAFGTIEDSGIIYSWFAVVAETPGMDGLPDLNFSRDDHPEYFVHGNEKTDTPDTLFKEMDLLHAHYLVNEERLRAERTRARTLQAARKRYLEENPPPPRETVINFFPVRSRLNPSKFD